MMVYFDTDGVFADFNRGVKELCNIDPIDQTNASENADETTWAKIRDISHFYYRLEQGAKEMFEYNTDSLGMTVRYVCRLFIG